MNCILKVALLSHWFFLGYAQDNLDSLTRAIQDANSQDTQKLAALYLERGTSQAQAKHYELAQADFEKIIELNVGNSPVKALAYHRSGYIDSLQQKWSQARSKLELAFEVWQQLEGQDLLKAKTLIVFSACEVELKNPAHALELAQQALSLRETNLPANRPEIANALMALGRAQSAASEPDAEESFRRAGKILAIQQPIDDQQFAQLYLLSSGHYLKSNKPDLAIQALLTGIDHTSDGSPTWQTMKLRLAESYLAKSETPHAEPHLRQLLKHEATTDQNRALANYGLGRIYKLWHNDMDAKAEFEKALPGLVNDSYVMINCLIHYAQVLRALNFDEEAIKAEAQIILFGGIEDDVKASRKVPIRIDEIAAPDPLKQ